MKIEHNTFYNMFECRSCHAEWCETNLTLKPEEVNCPKCGSINVFINEKAEKIN